MKQVFYHNNQHMCHKEGFSIPLFSFPDVSGHRKAWLIICFINLLQYLPYPTTADRDRLKLMAGVLGCQWRLSDNSDPWTEYSGNTRQNVWSHNISLLSQKLVPLFSSLVYAVEVQKKVSLVPAFCKSSRIQHPDAKIHSHRHAQRYQKV